MKHISVPPGHFNVVGFAQPDLLSAPGTCAGTHMHVCVCVLLSLSLSNVTPNLQQGTSSGVQPQKHLYVLMFEEKKKKKTSFFGTYCER